MMIYLLYLNSPIVHYILITLMLWKYFEDAKEIAYESKANTSDL